MVKATYCGWCCLNNRCVLSPTQTSLYWGFALGYFILKDNEVIDRKTTYVLAGFYALGMAVKFYCLQNTR
jgi:hypothetical protein